MTIDTYFSLFSLAGSSSTSASTSSAGTTGSSTSLFGPATLLSLGSSGSESSGGVYGPGSATGWTFDLAAVLTPTTTGLTEQYRSEEQIAQEEEAIALAFDYINGEQYDDAREVMNLLLKENPTNAAAVHALGYADLSEGKYEEAEQLFLKAHALNSTVGYDNDAANARILMGSDDEVLARASAMLKSSQHREEGIRLLMTLTERNAEHTLGRVALAEALLDAGEGENGLMQYNSAIQSADESELRLIEGNIESLVESAPNSAFVRQLLGKVLLKQERYEEALQTLTTAANLAEDPTPYQRDVASAQVGVGRERLKRGDLTGAMSAFTLAKELSPTNPDVKAALAEGYLARAEVYTQRGKYSAALDDYQQASVLLSGPSNRALRESASQRAYMLGRRLENRRIAAGAEIDSEVRAFQIAYDLDEDNHTYKRKLAETRNAIGDQAMAAGDYETAAASYRKAHDLYQYDETYKANTIAGYLAWGNERYDTHNWDDAITAFTELRKLDPEHAEAKTKLAESYNQRGLDHLYWERYRQAVSDFKNAMHLFPDNATYQANYDSVSHYDPNPQT